jgi:hypothetical protein
LIFHTHIVGEACSPSHQWQLFEAEANARTLTGNTEIIEGKEKEIIKHEIGIKDHTCLTSLYISLSNVNKTYD